MTTFYFSPSFKAMDNNNVDASPSSSYGSTTCYGKATTQCHPWDDDGDDKGQWDAAASLPSGFTMVLKSMVCCFLLKIMETSNSINAYMEEYPARAFETDEWVLISKSGKLDDSRDGVNKYQIKQILLVQPLLSQHKSTSENATMMRQQRIVVDEQDAFRALLAEKKSSPKPSSCHNVKKDKEPLKVLPQFQSTLGNATSTYSSPMVSQPTRNWWEPERKEDKPARPIYRARCTFPKDRNVWEMDAKRAAEAAEAAETPTLDNTDTESMTEESSHNNVVDDDASIAPSVSECQDTVLEEETFVAAEFAPQPTVTVKKVSTVLVETVTDDKEDSPKKVFEDAEWLFGKEFADSNVAFDIVKPLVVEPSIVKPSIVEPLVVKPFVVPTVVLSEQWDTTFLNTVPPTMGTTVRYGEYGTCQTASTLRVIAEEAFQAFQVSVETPSDHPFFLSEWEDWTRKVAPAPQVTKTDLLAIAQQEMEQHEALGVSHWVYPESATTTPKSHPFFKRRGERRMLYNLGDWHSYRQTYDPSTGDVTMLFETMEKVSEIDTKGWSKSINQMKQDILDLCDMALDEGL